MSAINPMIQTPLRLNPDQFNTDTGQNSAPAAQQGFSDTLNSVGAKPVRKSTSNKDPNRSGSGDHLPAAGNASPPAAVAANPATAPSAAATAATATGAAAPVPAAASAAAASPTPAAPAANAVGAAAGPAAAQSAAAAAAIDSLSPQELLPGPDGGPQSAAVAQSAAAAQAGAPTANGLPPTVGGAVTAAGVASTGKAAAKPANAAPSNWTAGASAAAMRAINPTGARANVTGGTSTGNPADSGHDPAADSSGAAATAAATVATVGTDATLATAAMLGAMQANAPASTAAADDADVPPPAGGSSNAIAAPLGQIAAGPDVPSALPALAAAAASAAQVVSTLAAGVAADKKSHGDPADGQSASAAPTASDAAAAAQLLNTPGGTHADAVPTFKVNAPVDSPDFSQNLASHVSTMLDGNVNSAKLQVNPPALGPIEVRIAIQGDHAQVWMASHSALTRDALQEAAPKLREMLNSQGFAQVSVDISQRSFQERTPMAHAYEWNNDAGAASASASSDAQSVNHRAPSGMLDAYA